jgi:hypothetical protein
MSLKVIQTILMSFYYLSIIGAIYCSIKYSCNHSTAFRRLTIYLSLTLLVEIITHYLNILQRPFLFIYVIFAPIEYFFISRLYLESFTNIFLRRSVLISIWFYTILSILAICYYQTNTHYLLFNLRGILIVSLTLIYFTTLYLKESDFELKDLPLFWVSVGNFLFWPGIFFVMSLVPVLVETNKELNDRIFLLNPFLNTVLYSMVMVSLLCNRKVRNS